LVRARRHDTAKRRLQVRNSHRAAARRRSSHHRLVDRVRRPSAPQLHPPPPGPTRRADSRGCHPAEPATGNSATSIASPRADLLNIRAQNTRLHQHINALEKRLSSQLGEAAFRDSGLGAPHDLHNLQTALTDREQLLELRRQLEERSDELAAARATNRELMTQLNTRH
jgi:hypothetical protein